MCVYTSLSAPQLALDAAKPVSRPGGGCLSRQNVDGKAGLKEGQDLMQKAVTLITPHYYV